MRGAALLAALLLAAGCRAAEAPPPPRSLEVDPGEPAALRTLAAVEVRGLTGPGGTPFSVAMRTPEIARFPCESCHGARGAARPAAGAPRAHAEIAPVHPADLGAECATCHDPADPGRLRLQGGRAVSLDESYLLCRQCHYRQADEWAAGAHGKRLGGWRGRRVVESCAGCHDAHAPRSARRMPVEFPRIPRSGPAAAGH